MEWPAAARTGTIGADVELVSRVARGSEEALAHLYDRFGQSVYAAARRLGSDPHGAEEIVQETFLVLWNRAETFDPALGSVQSWLLTIARNRTIDRFRAAARRVRALPFSTVLSDDADDSSALDWLVTSGELLTAGTPERGPESSALDGEMRSTLASALAALEPDERMPVMLAYREGLSQTEIAATLGWPLGTVKTRTRRALRRLRDALESGEAVAAAEALTTPEDAGRERATASCCAAG